MLIWIAHLLSFDLISYTSYAEFYVAYEFVYGYV